MCPMEPEPRQGTALRVLNGKYTCVPSLEVGQTPAYHNLTAHAAYTTSDCVSRS
jgi:hypothetical protein